MNQRGDQQPKEVILDLPKEAGIKKQTCIKTAFQPSDKKGKSRSNNVVQIKNISARILTIPAQPLSTNKKLGGDFISYIPDRNAGKTERIILRKEKAEYVCTPEFIKGPVTGGELKIKVENVNDAKVESPVKTDIGYKMNYVGRDKEPYNPKFDKEDADVRGVWEGTTKVPVQCSLKVTGS